MTKFPEILTGAKDDDLTAICQLHGRFHTPWIFRRSAPHFRKNGHPVIAPDLHCEIPGRNYQEQAKTVCLDMIASGYKKIALLAHSLSGNVALHVPDMLKQMTAAQDIGEIVISKMIFVTAVVNEKTATWLNEEQQQRAPNKNTLYYHAVMRSPLVQKDNNMQSIDYKTARETFYSRCSEYEAWLAFRHLREHWEDPNPPPIQKLPVEIPRYYLFCDNDNRHNSQANGDGVIDWHFQNYIREHVLQIPDHNAWTFRNTGHLPMYTSPALYAHQISAIMEKP